MGIVRRSTASGSPASSAVSLTDKGFWGGFPDLQAFMGQQTWPDGSSRLTGTVMLFAESGVWKAWLHDRDGGQGCFVSGATLEAVLKAAEKAVGAESGDWRPDRKGAKGR